MMFARIDREAAKAGMKARLDEEGVSAEDQKIFFEVLDGRSDCEFEKAVSIFWNMRV